MRYSAKSHAGMKREKNQDSYAIIDGSKNGPYFFIIADGMGGHNSGEVASKMAVDFAVNYVEGNNIEISRSNLPGFVKTMIGKANAGIYNKSLEKLEHNGMGTTFIVAAVKGENVQIGHIGDSRVYFINNKKMRKVTSDHSLIEELVKSGSITKEEAVNHPRKNVITKALGCMSEVEIDIYEVNAEKGDIMLLCTDGLTNMVDEERIESILLENDDPEKACEALINKANSSGGEDNVTVIVINFK